MRHGLLIAGDHPGDEAVLLVTFAELTELQLLLHAAVADDDCDPAVRRLHASVKATWRDMNQWRAEDGG